MAKVGDFRSKFYLEAWWNRRPSKEEEEELRNLLIETMFKFLNSKDAYSLQPTRLIEVKDDDES